MQKEIWLLVALLITLKMERDVIFVELPEEGKKVKQGDKIGGSRIDKNSFLFICSLSEK